MAQSPQVFNYQAIARNTNGTPIVNQAIKVQFSIHNISVTGNVIYQETDTATTNAFGLFTTQIGNGVVQQGNFSSISWAKGAKFLNVAFDPTGGNNFIDMGTTQLISVPYALYSDSSGKVAKQSLSLLHDTLSLTNGGNVNLGVYRDTFHYPNLSFHNDSLSIEHGNTVYLPYSASNNFVVRINGVPITDTSINMVMIQPNIFLTSKDYRFEWTYVPFTDDTFAITGSQNIYASTSTSCSPPFYISGSYSSLMKGTIFSVPNFGLYYIPLNASPVNITCLSSFSYNIANCTQITPATGLFLQALPNDPQVTGYSLSDRGVITFTRH